MITLREMADSTSHIASAVEPTSPQLSGPQEATEIERETTNLRTRFRNSTCVTFLVPKKIASSA